MVKQILCKLGFHRWRYFNITVPLSQPNPIRRKDIEVPVRKCTKCYKLQHHLMPLTNGNDLDWKDGEKFKKYL